MVLRFHNTTFGAGKNLTAAFLGNKNCKRFFLQFFIVEKKTQVFCKFLAVSVLFFVILLFLGFNKYFRAEKLYFRAKILIFALKIFNFRAEKLNFRAHSLFWQ